MGSMGAVGSAYDNALMESFFGSMQIELLDRRDWHTRTELASAIFEWIDLLQPDPPALLAGLPQPHRARTPSHQHPHRDMITQPSPSGTPGTGHRYRPTPALFAGWWRYSGANCRPHQVRCVVYVLRNVATGVNNVRDGSPSGGSRTSPSTRRSLTVEDDLTITFYDARGSRCR